MRNWAPTFPLLNYPLPEAPADPKDYWDWSVAELYTGRRLAPSAAAASPEPMSSMGARAEPATAASLPGWLKDAQWQATPGRLPELPPTAELDPFERAAISRRRSVIPDSRRRRPQMGPPFLDEPPQDYPSHLGPVPRAPDWEQTVTGSTPWSPLAKPPRATDWGQFVAGPECLVSDDSTTCTTQGGRTVTFPRGGLQPGTRFAPGESDYHSYNISDGPVRGDLSSITRGVINRPTRALPLFVRAASPEGPLNDATPPVGYPFGAALQTLRGRWPFSPGPVRSYLTRDQTGAEVVVNVTEPGHPLYPGVVIRYVTESSSGPIIRNEGTGRGWLQSPDGPARGGFNNQVWEGQAQEILDEQRRRRGWSRPLGGR